MINIKINDTEYTLEESQELYNELRKIFEGEEKKKNGKRYDWKDFGRSIGLLL